MKKCFLLISVCTIYLFLFSSCAEETDPLPGKAKTGGWDNPIQPEAVNLRIMARLVSEIANEYQVLDEVKSGVAQSLRYGMDEELRFRDILEPRESKMLRSSESVLLEILRKAIQKQSEADQLRSSFSLEEFILNENIQIYWPYSENWDGITQPVVSFDPKNGNEWNYAYRSMTLPSGETVLDSVIINDEYAMNNPVWIINQNNLEYEALPDFSAGETSKNGIRFLYESQQEEYEIKESSSLRASGDPVYVLRIGQFMASKNYDDVFNGGSEFVFSLGRCVSGTSSSNSVTETSYTRITRSRSDIKNKKWIAVNSIINSDWTTDQRECAFKIYEEDQGGTRYWEPEIKYMTWTVKPAIPYGSGDDSVYQIIYSRNFIFSTGNRMTSGSWITHTGGGVYWTLPYSIETAM